MDFLDSTALAVMQALFVPLLVLCGALALLAFLILPGESDNGQRRPFWGLNCAHRGLHSRDRAIPENSLAAFTAAVDAGYGIELDIRLSKDGEVVVFHDDDLLRVCGVHGRVDSYDWEELKGFSLFGTGQRIPLLREVLELIDGAVPLVVEFKTGPRRRMLCDNAWRILRQYDGDLCVESFDPRILRLFKKYVPGILRGQLAARPKDLATGLKGYAIGWGLCNFIGRPHFIAYQKGKRPPLIRLAMRFCMRVVWTVQPEDDYDAIEDANDAVIFEHYHPLPRYLDPLDEPLEDPAEEDYRF